MPVILPESLPDAVHGTAVALNGHALLFLGPSGSGKSSLALQMMALGAALVSDDLVWLSEAEEQVMLGIPPQASGPRAIEARGFGLLNARVTDPSPLCAIIDMSQCATDRLPAEKRVQVGPICVPLFHKVDTPSFPAVLRQYLMQPRRS